MRGSTECARRRPSQWPVEYGLEADPPRIEASDRAVTGSSDRNEGARSEITAKQRHHAGVPAGAAERVSDNDRAHRPSAAGAGGRRDVDRVGNVAGDRDMVVLAGAPTYWAPIKEVLAFHAEHRGAVAIAVGLEALNVPLLLGFLTGLHGLVGRRGGAGVDWSRLAVAAGASFSAVF